MSLINMIYVSGLYFLLSFISLSLIPDYSLLKCASSSLLVFALSFLIEWLTTILLKINKTFKHKVCLVLIVGIVFLFYIFDREILRYNISFYVISLLIIFNFIHNHNFKEHSVVDTIVYLMFLIGLSCLTLSTINYSLKMSPDSYSYYDISRNVLTNFGKVSTIRQYVLQTKYNISFPYLWPLVIYVVDKLTGFGIYSCVFAAFLTSIFTSILMIHFSESVSGNKNCGYILSFFLLTNIYYIDEVTNGRSIPFNIMLVLSAIYFLWKALNKGYMIDYVVSGFLFGCSAVNRFDSITILAFVTLVLCLHKRQSIKNLLAFAAAALIPLIPWLLFSLFKVGKIWATDNGGTMFMVDIYAPNRILENDVVYPTLFNSPVKWINSSFEKIKNVVFSLIACSPALLAFLGIYIMKAKRFEGHKNLKGNVKLVTATILIYYFLKTGMYSLVGYSDNRYHLETLIIISMFCVFLNYRFKRPSNEKLIVVFLVSLLVLSGYFSRGLIMKCIEKYSERSIETIIAIPPETSHLIESVNRITEPDDGILTIGFNGFELGAYDSDHYYYVSSYNGNKLERYMYAYNYGYIDAKYLMINNRRLNYSEIREIKEYLDQNAVLVLNDEEIAIYDVQKCFMQNK